MNNIWVCDIFKSLHSECIYKCHNFFGNWVERKYKNTPFKFIILQLYTNITKIYKYQEEKGQSLYIGAGRTKRGPVQKHTLWGSKVHFRSTYETQYEAES